MAVTDDAPLTLGKIVLAVRDLERVFGFYCDVMGLQEIGRDADHVELGAGGVVLVELRRDPQARAPSPREAGLFHTAFLLPTRTDLGAWVRHAALSGVLIQGASDHVVSEAVYLADPEGNGIEIYADRPRDSWSWMADGTVKMRTDQLDLAALTHDIADGSWRGAPEGTTIGHVHLQVGAIDRAEAFYRDVLGMSLTARYPGGTFFGSGGYHHHLAANIWNSRGAPPRTGRTTGLREIETRVRDAATLAGIAGRAISTGVSAEPRAGGWTLRDPWNTPIALVHADALVP